MSWLTESKEYTERMNEAYGKLTESCEKKLEEKNWKYTVPQQLSQEFHRLINADYADYNAIRDVLKKIAEFIKSKVDEDDWYYDDLLDDLEYAEFETDEDADYYIGEVYDLLDSYSIWMEPFTESRMKESSGLWGDIKSTDPRYQQVFDKAKELGYTPRKTWIDHGRYGLTSDSITIDVPVEVKKIPIDLLRYIDSLKLRCWSISTHYGKSSRKIKFALIPVDEGYGLKESLATMTDDGYLKFRVLRSKVDSDILLEEILNELETDEAESVVNELCIRYDIDIDEWMKRLNFYESKMKESEDGWNESVLEGCGDVLDKICDLTYEIKNCIKGAYTGCHTYEELADYIKDLADDLRGVADDVAYCCDNEDDEE